MPDDREPDPEDTKPELPNARRRSGEHDTTRIRCVNCGAGRLSPQESCVDCSGRGYLTRHEWTELVERRQRG